MSFIKRLFFEFTDFLGESASKVVLPWVFIIVGHYAILSFQGGNAERGSVIFFLLGLLMLWWMSADDK